MPDRRSVFDPLSVNISVDEIMADVREMKAELKTKDTHIAELTEKLAIQEVAYGSALQHILLLDHTLRSARESLVFVDDRYGLADDDNIIADIDTVLNVPRPEEHDHSKPPGSAAS